MFCDLSNLKFWRLVTRVTDEDDLEMIDEQVYFAREGILDDPILLPVIDQAVKRSIIAIGHNTVFMTNLYKMQIGLPLYIAMTKKFEDIYDNKAYWHSISCYTWSNSITHSMTGMVIAAGCGVTK